MLRTIPGINPVPSYKAHLAIAAKLLELPHDTERVVVECGIQYRADQDRRDAIAIRGGRSRKRDPPARGDVPPSRESRGLSAP